MANELGSGDKKKDQELILKFSQVMVTIIRCFQRNLSISDIGNCSYIWSCFAMLNYVQEKTIMYSNVFNRKLPNDQEISLLYFPI